MIKSTHFLFNLIQDVLQYVIRLPKLYILIYAMNAMCAQSSICVSG